MNPDYLWCLVINKLLQYFDNNEGTTYLYDMSAREAFVKTCPKELRERVAETLSNYHA